MVNMSIHVGKQESTHILRWQRRQFQNEDKYMKFFPVLPTQYTSIVPTNGMGFVGVGDTHRAMK